MSEKEKKKVEKTTEEKQDTPNKSMVFINISDNQIIKRFPSKLKKDKDGKPFQLAQILLPSKEYSANYLGKNASIVLPAFLVSDGKYPKPGRKVIALSADRDIEVHVQGKKVKDATKEKPAVYDNKTLKVSAQDLKKAFSMPEKKKEKEIESKK